MKVYGSKFRLLLYIDIHDSSGGGKVDRGVKGKCRGDYRGAGGVVGQQWGVFLMAPRHCERLGKMAHSSTLAARHLRQPLVIAPLFPLPSYVS